MTSEERIDRYLLGLMPVEEKVAFERELEENAELRQEFDDTRMIAEAVSAVKVRQIMAATEEIYQLQLETLADRYVLGDMDVAERTEFEAKMSDDQAVAELVDQHRLIARAVRDNHLKELFGEIESKAKNSIFDRVRSRTHVFYSFAAAACAALIVGMGVTFQQMGAYSQSAQTYLGQLEPVARDGDDVGDVLAVAYEQLVQGSKDAMKSIDEALSLIEEGVDGKLSGQELSEEDEYYIATLRFYEQDAQWYKALFYMQNRHVHKARRQLRQIMDSGGCHADEARTILEQNRLF